MNNIIRTRFAPSPSGFLHLGNLRTALFSYLAARESKGTFVLRIEDTDLSRTSEEYLQAIYKYLTWLGIEYDEGPHKGGPNGPYKQSERHTVYEKYLNILIEKQFVYRCFKTTEELEMERAKQIAYGLPPRYVRFNDPVQEAIFLQEGKPFVWRFQLPKGSTSIVDKARGVSIFELEHFADSPITRQDGSFTFLFANFVDDVEMDITYVIRGEEHISNTAIQSCMYEALGKKKPLYYHLPLLCDLQGKKLSKRDFGFSLQDLINAGFLPHAIINYLIIIGSSFEEEIFSLQEAIQRKAFFYTHSTGSIRYDIRKLAWINKQWMKKISPHDFVYVIHDVIIEKYGNETGAAILKNHALLSDLKEECENVNQCVEYINYFISSKRFHDVRPFVVDIINEWQKQQQDHTFESFKEIAGLYAKRLSLSQKEMWQEIRYYFIGSREGLSIKLILKYSIF